MTALATENPLPIYVDARGQLLTSGYIYFGQPDQDPREYPVSVYYDSGLTQSATQPLRTSGGYIFRNGAPTRVWVDGTYSMLVLDRNRRQVFYSPN